MANKAKRYTLEYEIPPLRAIYTRHCKASSESEIKEWVSANEPMWIVRKITEFVEVLKKPRTKRGKV